VRTHQKPLLNVLERIAANQHQMIQKLDQLIESLHSPFAAGAVQQKSPGALKPSEPVLLTVKQAADQLGISTGTVFGLCASKKLRHLRLGAGRGTIRIRITDLAEYLDGATVGPNASTPLPPRSKQGKKVADFTNLDGDRLLAAWQQQGVLAGRQGGRSAPSYGSSNGPAVRPAS
jgi:excisionase family DNA binding protein